MQKDLRDLLGDPVTGPYSRIYCGGPGAPGNARVRARCRAILLSTLRKAAGDAAKRYGSTSPSAWKIPATCEDKNPAICDQEVPTTAGALATPAPVL